MLRRLINGPKPLQLCRTFSGSKKKGPKNLQDVNKDNIEDALENEDIMQEMESKVADYEKVFGGTDIDKKLDKLIEEQFEKGMSEAQILQELMRGGGIPDEQSMNDGE